jgi:hypothetical protein
MTSFAFVLHIHLPFDEIHAVILPSFKVRLAVVSWD